MLRGAPILLLGWTSCNTEMLMKPAGDLSVDQVWEKSFERLDVDGDGRLNRWEFGAPGPGGERLAGVDANSDDGIDLTEWVAMVVGRPPRHQRDLRREFFEPPFNSDVSPLTAEETAARTALFRRRSTPPSREGPPNILLIGMDTVRADHLSLYGHHQDTSPNLTALARRGVVFDNSIANANESLYSHASLWTSRYASEVARPNYKTYVIPDTAQTLSEVLKAYGYSTGGFVAGGHLDGDFGHAQGFDVYEATVGFGSFWNTIPTFLNWLDEQDGTSPWFALVHSYDAHAPYQTSPPFVHAFADGGGPYEMDRLLRDPMFPERVKDNRYYPGQSSFFHHPSGFNILGTESYETLDQSSDAESTALSAREVAHLQDHYDGCVAYADMQVGVILAALEARGWSEQTVVIVVGDHGEDLLDHRYVNHRTGLTDSIIRVPTVVAGPGFPAAKRVPEMVQALDLLPTVVRVVGGVVPVGVRGRPLQDVASGVAPPLEAVFSEGVMNQLSVRTPTHKLIASQVDLMAPDFLTHLKQRSLSAGLFQLYDLRVDPREQNNLLVAPTAASEAIASGLRGAIVDWRTELALGTAQRERSAVDPVVAEQMRRHGYWEKAAAKQP